MHLANVTPNLASELYAPSSPARIQGHDASQASRKLDSVKIQHATQVLPTMRVSQENRIRVLLIPPYKHAENPVG
jgi:hypothetical protein